MPAPYDAIVIGTGQSGPSLAARLVQEGQRTAILERKLFGGTCVNVGCIPTKTLVASARVAHVARRAAEFGVQVGGPVQVDMRAVKARKDAVVKQSNEGVTRWLKGMQGLDVYEGQGRFVAPHRVQVNGQGLEAARIFVNVGARAFVPPIPGIDKVEALTNSDMMEVDFLPEHLVIIGGSYIGLEFAQMYRRFGSKVTVIEMAERLIPRDDDDVSAAVREIVEAEGVVVHTGSQVQGVDRRGKTVAVQVQGPAGALEVQGSHLLVAVGRRPNTDDLGVDAAGIETDPRGFIRVDDQLRTNVEGVWAIGDCNGLGAFTHTSYNDYEIVEANLFDHTPRKVSDRILTYGLFIDPPLGRAGLTEREVRATGKPALMGKMPMQRVGRARERGETQGFMKVLADAESGKLLGASILGIGGDEVVHVLLTAMYAGMTYEELRKSVFIHPTVSELLPTLMHNLEPLT